MTAHTFIKIKRLTKLTPQTQALPIVDEKLEAEPIQPLEIEQPEQPVQTL